MPTYKNLRAGAIQLDPLVKRNEKGEIVHRSEARLIGPGAEFIAQESEVPVSWLGANGHPQFVELVSRGEKKVLSSPLDHDEPPQTADVPKTDALLPESKPPVDPVGDLTPPGRAPAPEAVAAAEKAEVAAATNQVDKVAKPATGGSTRADKPAK